MASTPDEHKTDGDNILKRRGRKNIHDHHEEDIEDRRSSGETSPILRKDEPEVDSDENLEEDSIGLLKDNELIHETTIPQTSFISKNYIIAGLIVFFIICASWIWKYSINQSIETIRNINDEEFSQKIHHLQSKYNSVNANVFTELESAVKLTNRHGLPQSFVFAHHSNEKTTKMTLTLIKDLAQLASQYLGNGSILTISPDNFDTEDYGELLTLWRPDIEQGHAVVVANLQQVPAHLAPVFHTLCDDVTPYVRGTLYLHTVNLGSNTPSTQQRNNKTGRGYFTTVQKRLRQSWPNMANEIFDPLVTRIAGSVHILD